MVPPRPNGPGRNLFGGRRDAAPYANFLVWRTAVGPASGRPRAHTMRPYAKFGSDTPPQGWPLAARSIHPNQPCRARCPHRAAPGGCRRPPSRIFPACRAAPWGRRQNGSPGPSGTPAPTQNLGRPHLPRGGLWPPVPYIQTSPVGPDAPSGRARRMPQAEKAPSGRRPGGAHIFYISWLFSRDCLMSHSFWDRST